MGGNRSFSRGLRSVVWAACCSLLLACRSDGGARAIAEVEAPAAEKAVLSTLDLQHRTIARLLGHQLVDPATVRFVEVEIVDVVNPKRLRLTFEVYDRRESGESLLLGSFALFPPDNPGTFLVATKGLLRGGDTIVLSMQVLDEVSPQDDLVVKVQRISFRRE